jgi:hypothetical protein
MRGGAQGSTGVRAHSLCTTDTPLLSASRATEAGALTPKHTRQAPVSAASCTSRELGGPTPAPTTLNTMRPVLTASSDDVSASSEPSTSACSISGIDGLSTLQAAAQARERDARDGAAGEQAAVCA